MNEHTTDTDETTAADENRLIAERRQKLATLKSAGQAFPNDFRRDALAGSLADSFGEKPAEWFEANPMRVRVAGRMLAKRDMGKSSFVRLADRSGEIQLYLQANLLGDGPEQLAAENLERIRRLFEDLENKTEMVRLVELARDATGVRIYIGSENNLFSLSGSSVIVAPFQDGNRRVVGAIGVIGPTRMNYARIVPMVDYTARVVGRILG